MFIKLFLPSITLFILSFGLFAQEKQFDKIRGYEDEQGNTQLYIEIKEYRECTYEGYSYNNFIKSSIIQFDVKEAKEIKRIPGSDINYYEYCSRSSYDILLDFQVSGSDSNFVRIDKSGNRNFQDFELETNSYWIYLSGTSHRVIKHPFSTDVYLFDSYKTIPLKFNYDSTENPGDSLYSKKSLAYKIIAPLTTRNDSALFYFNSDTLFKTNDLNQTSEVSIANVTDFISDVNDSLSIIGESYLNMYHTYSSKKFFWYVEALNKQQDSASYFLLMSNNLGKADSWSVSELDFLRQSNLDNPDAHKFTARLALNNEDEIYLYSDNKLYKSATDHISFSEHLTFQNSIKDIYAKPNSNILYVLTETDLYKVGNGQPTSIKQVPVSSESEPEIPEQISLHQNYPNPFNPSTTIQFDLKESAFTKLTVYDLLGRKVKELVNDVRPAGTNTVQFNASDLASGVYLYRLEAGSFVQTKRLTLIK